MMLLLELASQNEFNTESDQKVKWEIQVSYDIQQSEIYIYVYIFFIIRGWLSLRFYDDRFD